MEMRPKDPSGKASFRRANRAAYQRRCALAAWLTSWMDGGGRDEGLNLSSGKV